MPVDRRALALVFVTAVACHAAGVAGGFVLDDRRVVLGHPAVNGSAPLHEVFTRDAWGEPLGTGQAILWRPLASLTLGIERRITTDAWLPHAVNVLLFAALACCVTALAAGRASPGAALLAGLAFATLPALVEGVASVTSRADLLAALLGCGAILVLERGEGRHVRVAGAAAMYLGAVLSKESAIAVPAVAAWLAIASRPRGWREAARALAPALALAAVGLAYLAVRSGFAWIAPQVAFTSADNPLSDRECLVRAWGVLYVLGRYAELVIAPVRLCCDHTWADAAPPASFPGDGAAWAVAGLALAVVAVVDAARALTGRGKGLWATAAVSYLLVGHVLGPISVILAERLLMWPVAWAAVAAAASASAVLERVTARRLAVAAAAPLIALGARTVERTLDWRDEATLFQAQVETCPGAVHGRLMHAQALSAQGRTHEALWSYGLAAAGRASWPTPLPEEAFDGDRGPDVARRLRELPGIAGATDAPRYFRSLAAMLRGLGAEAEARLAEGLAGGQ